MVVRTEKKGAVDQPDEGERWGCLVQDRDSRFVVACATGPLNEDLIERAVTTTVARTQQRELHWFSDGWHGYRSILVRAYRKRVLTGKTHAFAKRDANWDALVRLQLFDHNFHRAHQALRLPFEDGVRRYRPRSPAMVLGLTDHLWSFQELLTSRVPITPS